MGGVAGLLQKGGQHGEACGYSTRPQGLQGPVLSAQVVGVPGWYISFCRIPFQTREKFKEHQKEDWAEKTKCNMCGHKLNCRALKKHMENMHEKEIGWVVQHQPGAPS